MRRENGGVGVPGFNKLPQIVHASSEIGFGALNTADASEHAFVLILLPIFGLPAPLFGRFLFMRFH